ncbi:MAG: hypothetical protein WCD20_03335 [Rhodomicrobium sp.]
MGGYLSGGGRDASKCEAMRRIEMSWMREMGYLNPGRWATISWNRGGDPTGSIGTRAHDGWLELNYSVNGVPVNEAIYYRRTRTNFGGWRDWFECPKCRRACSVLYGGKYFRCRKCYRLTYSSQYEEAWERVRGKAERVRKKLGDRKSVSAGDFNPFPPRPKGMHHRTYARLEQQDFAYQERLALGFEAAFYSRFGRKLDR